MYHIIKWEDTYFCWLRRERGVGLRLRGRSSRFPGSGGGDLRGDLGVLARGEDEGGP